MWKINSFIFGLQVPFLAKQVVPASGLSSAATEKLYKQEILKSKRIWEIFFSFPWAETSKFHTKYSTKSDM